MPLPPNLSSSSPSDPTTTHFLSPALQSVSRAQSTKNGAKSGAGTRERGDRGDRAEDRLSTSPVRHAAPGHPCLPGSHGPFHPGSEALQALSRQLLEFTSHIKCSDRSCRKEACLMVLK